MPAKAVAKGVGASARRVRPILDVIRGRRVREALSILSILPSPWARTVAKVVRSAAANAENNLMMNPDRLRIVAVYADGAASLKRYRPETRGRIGRIRKRTSHITVIVDEEVAGGP